MLPTQRARLTVLVLTLLVVVAGGCASPSPTPCPKPTPDTSMLIPEEVVVDYWSAIDNGRYTDAYQLTYHDQNVSREDWLHEHEAAYGPNGSYVEIHKLAIADSFPLNQSTFEGNFSAVQVVLVNIQMSYQGTNKTGSVQFPVVKTENGWKIYGDY